MKKHLLAFVVGFAVVAAVPLALWIGVGSTPWAAAARAWGRFSYRAVSPYEGDILLPIPFDPQDHALSCEAAALKMALAYRGVAVSEDDIMEVIGFDPTPRTRNPDGTVLWGDPDAAFVGDIDGRMMSTGYGVHWGPVSRAANTWRLAQVIQGWTAAEVARQLVLGNPIIAWGYVGPGTPYEWQTPERRRVRTVLREHAFVLNGFRGTAESPEGLYFMDPVYGQRYLPTSDFLKNWGVFDNAGVILY